MDVPREHAQFWRLMVGLFEPDILIDAGRRRATGLLPAERRLMAAILADAIDCLRKNLCTQDRRKRRLYTEAEKWILSDEAEWVFSFRNICDVLGFDVMALRAQAQEWKRDRRDSIGLARPLASP